MLEEVVVCPDDNEASNRYYQPLEIRRECK